MRWNSPHFRLLGLLGAFGVVFVFLQLGGYEPTPQSTREDGPLTKSQIEQDLQLRVELDPRSQTIVAGGEPWVKAKLVNTSRTRTHHVVKSDAGSEFANREPHFHWMATIERDGKHTPVPQRDITHYCGMTLIMASAWERDWVELPPGGELPLEGRPPFEFQQAGRARLQAHYDFRWDRGNYGKKLKETSPFAYVPAFSISSEPVEFDVTRPLDVRLKVKGPLKADKKTRLSDSLSITLVNQSGEPFTYSFPTPHADARVYLEIEEEPSGWRWRPSIDTEHSQSCIEKTLQPGEEVSLLNAGDFASGTDGIWETPAGGGVKIRAGFTPATRRYSPTIWSEWIEVQVIG